MEAYSLPRSHKVASVDVPENPIVTAVQDKQDAMMEMLQTMMERLDWLEKQIPISPRGGLTFASNRPNTPSLNQPSANHLSEVRSGGSLCPWLCKSTTSKPVHP